MKILLVNDSAAPVGGAEIMTQTLRRGLERRGHVVRLLAAGSGGDADFRCRSASPPLQTLLQTANPSALATLRLALRSFRPDVVHVRMCLTQLSPLILPPLRRVPSLYHAVWYEAICPVGSKLRPDGTVCNTPAGAACRVCLPLRGWLPAMLKLRLWRRGRDAFDAVVANSEATRGRLLAEGIGVDEVVWNGVPAHPGRPPLSGPPTVAFAGRLVPEKGVDVLLHAFAAVAAAIPDAQLLVAGDGPLRGRLEAEAASRGIAGRVTFLGHLDRAEVERHLAFAWVQAVPSVWDEPFGIVAAEAMMRGTAVVASRGGGLAEIVADGETGTLFTPGDPDALARALLPLLSDRQRAERMGRAGRERAIAHFGEDTFVDRFVAIYGRLTERTGPRGRVPDHSPRARETTETTA